MSVVTALTSQNTLTVDSVHEVDPDFVEKQFRAVVSDIGCDVVKTGMLASSAIVTRVASLLREYGLRNVVVDPVGPHRNLDWN